jgi:hypothetical protein
MHTVINETVLLECRHFVELVGHCNDITCTLMSCFRLESIIYWFSYLPSVVSVNSLTALLATVQRDAKIAVL